MAEQATFSLRGRNPDVLTCIASLSNDEVFTPPELAGQMLDALADAWADANAGADIWADKTVRFLDPCAKSGIFLREVTSRLIRGLADEIPDLETRVAHILTQQVFGIAMTQLTALLARRSVYCSKFANGEHSVVSDFANPDGNVWFERTEHVWGNDQKCTQCGANQRDYDRGPGLETHAYAFIHAADINVRLAEIFGDEMQFDVIIGNPPYQLGQSGGEAVGGFAMPIYQSFVEAAKSLDPRFLVMVTPSRWFAGGRGLDEYRKNMLADSRVRKLVDFPDAAEAFPGQQIKGGVSYFLWDSSWNGDCDVSTVIAGEVSGPVRRSLNAYDVFVRWNDAVPILEKVRKRTEAEGRGSVASHVSPIQPFSIRTNFRGAESPRGLKKPVRLIGRKGDSYIPRSDVPRHDEWIDQWKVLLGQAYGAGDGFPHQIYNKPIIAGPGTACTETYLVVNRFQTKEEAERFAAYLRTRFVRFLVSLRKNTQHIYNERFQFVPDLPMDRDWDDAALYKKYGVTKTEIAFIESMIRPMGEDDG